MVKKVLTSALFKLKQSEITPTTRNVHPIQHNGEIFQFLTSLLFIPGIMKLAQNTYISFIVWETKIFHPYTLIRPDRQLLLIISLEGL